MRDRVSTLNRKMNGLVFPLILLPVWILLYLNLSFISTYIVHTVLGLEKDFHLTRSIQFFIFEVPKVLMLLILIIFIVGIIRSYFTPEKTRKTLEGKTLFTGNILAALLGIVTPFCTCSAIPLFLGFVEAGIPLGVTFSFLIAAPMINEVAVVLLLGMFGLKVTLIYVGTGFFISVLSGWFIQKLKLERYVADWVYKIKTDLEPDEENTMTFYSRVKKGYEAVSDIVGKIWIYILIGIGVGAAVHGYVPENFLGELMGGSVFFGVPLAILIGIPMYSNAAGIIPIVSVLIEKGVSLGTALAFMMSVIALSLPEIIILKKVLHWRLITIFVGIVAAGILLVGYIFNLLL